MRARLKPAGIQEWLHRWAGPSAGPTQRLVIPLARAGYGAALLCAPGPMIRLRTGQTPSRRASQVARVLGIRHLVQATITAWAPAPETVAIGAVLDLCHAASMLAFAARYKSLRRAELADALVAAALAVAEPTLARRPANGG